MYCQSTSNPHAEVLQDLTMYGCERSSSLCGCSLHPSHSAQFWHAGSFQPAASAALAQVVPSQASALTEDSGRPSSQPSMDTGTANASQPVSHPTAVPTGPNGPPPQPATESKPAQHERDSAQEGLRDDALLKAPMSGPAGAHIFPLPGRCTNKGCP